MYDAISKPAIEVPGRPVRYQLTDGAYRYVGDGAWPEHEPAEVEPEHEPATEGEPGYEISPEAILEAIKDEYEMTD